MRLWIKEKTLYNDMDRLDIVTLIQLDYKMVYYNPWDAQYLSYLVVEYDDKSYEEEIQRLEQYDSKEYKGYFWSERFSR